MNILCFGRLTLFCPTYFFSNSASPQALETGRRSFRIPPNHCQTTGVLATPNSSQLDNLRQSSPPSRSKQPQQSNRASPAGPLDCQTPGQTGADLLYLNILNDAVKDATESSRHHTSSSTPCGSMPEDSSMPQNCLWTRPTELDDIDNEYLLKKGVFDLPPRYHL